MDDDVSELMHIKKLMIEHVFEILNGEDLTADQYCCVMANMVCDLSVIMTHSLQGTKEEKEKFLIDFHKLVMESFETTYIKSEQSKLILKVLKELQKSFGV